MNRWHVQTVAVQTYEEAIIPEKRRKFPEPPSCGDYFGRVK